MTYHASKTKKQYGYLEALPYYEYAHQWRECSTDPTHFAWYIELELAQAYHRLGDLVKARYFYNLTFDLIREKLTHKIPLLWSDLALIHIAEGNIDDALTLFRNGYHFHYPEESAPIDMLRGKLANAHGLADLYTKLNQTDSALFYILQVEPLLEVVRDRPAGPGYYIDHFSTKGRLLGHDGANKEAIDAFEVALIHARSQYTGETSREIAKIYVELSRAFLNLNQWQKADSLVQCGYTSLIPEYSANQRFPSAHSIYAENTFFDLVIVQAETYKHRFHLTNNHHLLDTALHLLTIAWSANDQLTTRYSPSNTGFLNSADNKKLYSHAISLIAASKSSDDSLDIQQQVLSLSRRLKGNVLKRSKSENCRFNALPDSLQDIVQSLDIKLVELRRQAARQHQSRDSLFPVIEKIHHSIQALLSPMQEQCTAHHQDPLEGYFVEFVFSDDSLFAIDNFNRGFRLTTIGHRDTILALARQFQDVISNKSPYKGICRLLYQHTLQSIAPLPEEFRVIADGELALVPFGAMLDEEENFLVENHTIHYDYFIEEDRSNAHLDQNANLLIVKSRYEEAPVPELVLSRDNEYALAWVNSEISEINASWDDEIHIKEPVGKDSFNYWAREADLLHFAGHARSSGDDAWLLLRNYDDEIIKLYDYEIAGVRNDLHLVVLSACESGLGKFIPGEGLMSLGRSFIESGTHSCIMSLWNVNDRSTSHLMSNFYQNLNKGHTTANALSHATRKYLKDADPELRHPYYWSGFVQYGQNHVIVKKNRFIWLLIILFVPIIYWLYHRKKPN